MAEKPTYLGLLNGVSIAEGNAADYLEAWLERATDPDLRATLRTVAYREREHSLAFAKRINELGFEVQPSDRIPDFAEQMSIVTSDCSDYEKAEALGLFKARSTDPDAPDIFSGFFNDTTIDIQTGALLGRYVCEERDTGRMIAACAAKLKAKHDGGDGVSSDRLAALESKLDQVCDAVTQLTAAVAAGTGTNGTKSKTKSRAASS